MNTVGDFLANAQKKAFKSIAVLASIIVYIAMLTYTATHNYTLMASGVSNDLLVWAVVGVVALEITALALPITIHYWAFAPLQRMTAIGFYLLDLSLLWLNVALDFARVSGGALPSWMQIYFQFVVPATPLVAGFGWSLIWMLDPAQREMATQEALRASARETLAQRLEEAARDAAINETVRLAAEAMAREIVHKSLGVYAPPLVIPARTSPASTAVPSGNGSVSVPVPATGNDGQVGNPTEAPQQ